jgi:hypothetical protein
MIRSPRSLVLVTLVASMAVGVSGVASRAFAQSASVQAQALFDSGRKLMAAGKFAEACTAFESSQSLDPVVTTLLNLADCREQNQQLATAWGAFVDANRMARNANNQKFANVASNHARKLEPRLSKLAISVPAAHKVPGLEVLRGTELVHPAAWNNPLPIDGGTYTITARAPGRATWKTTRTIKVEADNVTVEIPQLAVAGSGPVAASAPIRPAAPIKPSEPVTAKPAPPRPSEPAIAKPAPPRPSEPAIAKPAPPRPGELVVKPTDTSSTAGAQLPDPVVVDDARGRSSRVPVVPLALGVGSLVLGGTAIGFNFWGDQAYDQAKASMSPSDRAKLFQSANNRRYAAQAFGVAAVACAGTAVYLYLRGRNADRAEPVGVLPVASPQFAGLAVAGGW